MFQPLTLYLAARYVQPRRRKRFTNFIALVSVAGIALGVAALIIVLSVMNGFEREVVRHVLGMTAHAQLILPPGRDQNWENLLTQAQGSASVVGASPYARASGMVSRNGQTRGVVIEGVLPTAEAATTDLGDYLVDVELAQLTPGSRQVLVGSELARQLDLQPGGQLTLVVPSWDVRGQLRAPRYLALEVAGLFHVGMNQFDARLLITHLHDAQELFGLGNTISGIRLRLNDSAAAPVQARVLAKALSPSLQVIDWTQYHRNFFIALASQKHMMFVILTLIMAVAAFNIAANMIIMVTDKTADIATLRTLGMTRQRILVLFLFQGLFIGLTGTLLGALLGAWGAAESASVAAALEHVLGIDLINTQVYYIDYLPAELRSEDVLAVSIAALTLALLATVYPALRAASVEPARATHRD